MPIRPPPITYRCPECGWYKTVHPRSDVLTPREILLGRCPRCGHQHLVEKRGGESPWERFLRALTD